MTIRQRELHRDRDEHGGGHRPAWLTLDTWACLFIRHAGNARARIGS